MSLKRKATPDRVASDESSAAAVRALLVACTAAADGDLEARVDHITGQVDAMQEVAGASSAAMGTVEDTVQEMAPMVDAVLIALRRG